MAALERLGLRQSYRLVVARARQLVRDQLHDLVQRPEFQQIYVVGNEIYQQVRAWSTHGGGGGCGWWVMVGGGG